MVDSGFKVSSCKLTQKLNYMVNFTEKLKGVFPVACPGTWVQGLPWGS